MVSATEARALLDAMETQHMERIAAVIRDALDAAEMHAGMEAQRYSGQIAELEAEVERLREAHRAKTVEASYQQQRAEKAEEEVELLRESSNPADLAENLRLKAEVERLRSAVPAFSFDGIEMSHRLEVAEHRADRAEAEVERWKGEWTQAVLLADANAAEVERLRERIAEDEGALEHYSQVSIPRLTAAIARVEALCDSTAEFRQTTPDGYGTYAVLSVRQVRAALRGSES